MKRTLDSGILFFPGNGESPMNYADNTYHFRQDSTFLYYWGIDDPGFAAVIDLDSGDEIIFGDDFTIDDIIWMGPQEKVSEKAEKAGVSKTKTMYDLDVMMKEWASSGRKIHFLPQYRAENIIFISNLINIPVNEVNKNVSPEFIKAVAEQRNVKADEEVQEIVKALDISYEMYRLAMKLTKPGIKEYKVCGMVEGTVAANGSFISFPVIYSVHGETLHNHHHNNIMKDGDIVVLDSGAESPLHYASDITRTLPVSGRFTSVQRDVYSVCLNAQMEAIDMIKPGIFYKDVHLHAAKVITQGLQDIGLMKGDADESVAAGAHALFFPHGLGHMMGLDVHDMENLGEQYIGYGDELERSSQFGLAFLRLGRALKPGFVLTAEPGIYFIPALIDQWQKENKLTQFINYDKVNEFRGFGGIRIEDDVLVTEQGHRVLGKPIAKTIEDVEKWCAE
ncbi:aminopeptidase P family protein [bacterium]|nr:aminopeptidase P family protein [bacterium]